MLNIYRVQYSNGNSLEITTKKTLATDFIKSELEKISKCDVVKVQELTNTEVYKVSNPEVDCYFGVDYDFLGFPRKFNRLLIPNIKDEFKGDSSTDLFLNKMETITKNLYGDDVRLCGLRRY